MPPEQRPVWTTMRKVTGNVLPLVVASPLLAKAFLVFASKGVSKETVLWAALFLVATWLAVAFLGLTSNRKMKNEMSRRMHIDRPFDHTEKYFVGIASPTYASALDPHEDVGFLLLHPEHLEFFGSHRHFLMNKRDVVRVRFRANTHTVLGLGRWVAVEAVVGGIPARLLVEPREKRSLFGNLAFSTFVKQRIERWIQEDPRTEVRGSLEASSES